MTEQVITYGIQLVRVRDDVVERIITVNGYGLFTEALDDILEMAEKEKFDVTTK